MASSAWWWRSLAAVCSVLGLSAGCESTPLDVPAAGAPAVAGASAEAGSGGSIDAAGSAGEIEEGGAAGQAATEPGFTDGTTVLDRATMSSDAAAEFQQNAAAPVRFDGAVARATLRVRLESPCFPFSGWSKLETTAGHNWPDACDAFDRQFLISLDGEDGGVGNGKAPGIELTRAITPFGGPLSFDTDITDVVNGLPGKHTLRVEIPTYGDPDGKVTGSKGSWIVSVNILIEPGDAPRKVLAVLPLVFSPQNNATPAPFAFEAPEGTGSARIEYRATGHGLGAGSAIACIGPAEEFCHRTHTLALDGNELLKFDPWRTDCAKLCTSATNTSGIGIKQYCRENPCGAPQSVRASRANWCPGSLTAPVVLDDESLAVPGPHEFSLQVDELADGGNWLVSATYFAFE